MKDEGRDGMMSLWLWRWIRDGARADQRLMTGCRYCASDAAPDPEASGQSQQPVAIRDAKRMPILAIPRVCHLPPAIGAYREWKCVTRVHRVPLAAAPR